LALGSTEDPLVLITNKFMVTTHTVVKTLVVIVSQTVALAYREALATANIPAAAKRV
jgi:hypothetical protein